MIHIGHLEKDCPICPKLDLPGYEDVKAYLTGVPRVYPVAKSLKRQLPCVHLGKDTGEKVPCKCRDGTDLKVFACEVHGKCTIGKAGGYAVCPCPDYSPRKVELLPGLPDPIPDAELQPIPAGWANRPEVRREHIAAFRSLLGTEFPPPDRAEGQGVLICGGGRYWPMIVCAVRMLRDVSDLPVQVWHRGRDEPTDPGDLDGVPDVEIIDATKFPHRKLGGWEIKSLALIHCGWERVLYMDADAYAVRDPAPLLELATDENPFVFWQDMSSHDTGKIKWEAFGLPDAAGVPCVQGGQLVIHRRAWWRRLVLFHWLNQHSDYSYAHGYGDQDLYRVVLAATQGSYQCLGRAPWVFPAFVCSLEGSPLIVHRCRGKLWENDWKETNRLPGDDRLFGHWQSQQNHWQRYLSVKVEASKVFGDIYRTGLWGHGDKSGGGSTEKEAAPYLDLVNGFMRSHTCSSVVDLGCGDGWITSRLVGSIITGVDVYRPHLERLRREVPGACWDHLDIDKDREQLPSGDVAFLKDTLHHWPTALILDWLEWARASGKWKYLILTNDFPNASDRDTPLGGYRALSLDCPPLSQVPGLQLVGRYLHKEVLLLQCP